jgi:hypothetical protein
MMSGGASLGELDCLLDTLVSSVLGVRIAVILSPDGLSLGRSPGLSEADAGHPAVLVKRVGQHMIENPRFPVQDPVSR